MPCCKCEKYGWEDPQEVVYTAAEDDKEYCLFHAPAEHKYDQLGGEKMSVDEFNARVFERIQATIDLNDENAECILAGTIFPGDISFNKFCVLPEIFFDYCLFMGRAIFSVNFKDGASFTDCIFNGYTDFNNANFEFWVYFYSSKFCERGNFTDCEFKQNQVHFISTVFWGLAIFNNIKFEKTTQTINEVEPLLRLGHCDISQGILSFKDCKDLSFFDLTEQYNLTNIHFINSSWEKNGRIKASTEDARLQPTRDFYQRMKAKYKAENNEYEASKWHIAEKEAQLKLLGQRKGEKFNWLMLSLYEFSSGFGENPRRAFGVLLGALMFPLLVLTGVEVAHHFAWWNFDFVKVNHVCKEWLKFIPLTRAITPNDPGMLHAIMIVWQLLISLQAALFAFALRNNFRR